MQRNLESFAIGAGLACALIALAAPSSGQVRLSTVPDTVYKVADPGRAHTESWYFNLVVADEQDREGIQPLSAELQILSGSILLETIGLPASTLAQMRSTSYKVTRETDALSTRRIFSLDEAFDFRFGFPERPLAWGADRVRITITLEVPERGPTRAAIEVPLRTYSQRTDLIFPLRGPAVITQGPINNSGHAGHSNQFAIDIMGLNAAYGPLNNGGQGNAQFAGWGREIIAPSGGRVVYARNDVPDNPPDGDPRAVYSKVPEPLLAIAGNCIVIDHGNGEFSVMMHLQRGTVAVEVGSTVRQGQVIARLGHSGDAFGAHLHYQLQDGPDLFRANSVPARFSNLPRVELARGVYVEPR